MAGGVGHLAHRLRRGSADALLRGGGAMWLLGPSLLLLAVFLLVPLVTVVTTTFANLGFQGFLDATLGDSLFRRALWRTLMLASVVTAVTWLVGVVYALAIATAGRKFAVALLVVLASTFWISLLVRTYGWVLLLQPAGVLDTLARELKLSSDGLGWFQTEPSVYPAMVHIMLPYTVIPIYAALRQLDQSQLRASRSLGASSWLTLRKVVLPAIRPASLASAVLVFSLSLGFYVTPAFLGGPDQQLVAIRIGIEFSQAHDTATASAMGCVLLVAVVALYVIADWRWRFNERLGAA